MHGRQLHSLRAADDRAATEESVQEIEIGVNEQVR